MSDAAENREIIARIKVAMQEQAKERTSDADRAGHQHEVREPYTKMADADREAGRAVSKAIQPAI